MKKNLSLLMMAAVLALLAAAPASAQAPTDQQFAAQADAVCKSYAPRSAKLQKAYQGQLAKKHRRKAKTLLHRGAKHTRGGLKKIRALPRPPAKQKIIGRWLKSELRLVKSGVSLGDFVLRKNVKKSDVPKIKRRTKALGRVAKRALKLRKRTGLTFAACGKGGA